MKSWLWGVGSLAIALTGCGEGTESRESDFPVPTSLVDCAKNTQTRLYADPAKIENVPDYTDPLWQDTVHEVTLTICNGGAQALGILEIRRLEEGESGAGRLDPYALGDFEPPFTLPAGKGLSTEIGRNAYDESPGASYTLRFICDDSSLAPLEVPISY